MKLLHILFVYSLCCFATLASANNSLAPVRELFRELTGGTALNNVKRVVLKERIIADLLGLLENNNLVGIAEIEEAKTIADNDILKSQKTKDKLIRLRKTLHSKLENLAAIAKGVFSAEEVHAMFSLKRIPQGTAITFTPSQDVKFELAWDTSPSSKIAAAFARQGCSWKTIENESLVINYIPNRNIRGRGESLTVYLNAYLGSSPQGFSCRVEKAAATHGWYIKCEAREKPFGFPDSYFQGAKCPYGP